MQCTRCGRDLSEQARFCPDCGLKIERTGDVGANEAPASSGLPGLPPLPASKESVEAEFVPASFDNVTPPIKPVTTPAPMPIPTLNPQAAAPAPSAPVSSVSQTYVAPTVLLPQYTYKEESEYYTFDATEKPDFEAIRGISIVLIVMSVLTIFGVLFPLPICIVALVMACTGKSDPDPLSAKRKFNTCRILTIVSVISVALLYIGLFVLRYLMNYTDLFVV